MSETLQLVSEVTENFTEYTTVDIIASVVALAFTRVYEISIVNYTDGPDNVSDLYHHIICNDWDTSVRKGFMYKPNY